jgi:hypothetical protein
VQCLEGEKGNEIFLHQLFHMFLKGPRKKNTKTFRIYAIPDSRIAIAIAFVSCDECNEHKE